MYFFNKKAKSCIIHARFCNIKCIKLHFYAVLTHFTLLIIYIRYILQAAKIPHFLGIIYQFKLFLHLFNLHN
jgi:hypothetical protein